jgi:hypothetical protein
LLTHGLFPYNGFIVPSKKAIASFISIQSRERPYLNYAVSRAKEMVREKKRQQSENKIYICIATQNRACDINAKNDRH